MNTKIKKFLIAFLITILLFSTFDFANAWYTKLPGGLTLFTSMHTHYLGGCIKTVAPHVNLGINKGSQELVNLHLAKWNSCFGIYSTGKVSFCWKICWGNYWTWVYYIALALSICLAAYFIYLSWSIFIWIAQIVLSFI